MFHLVVTCVDRKVSEGPSISDSIDELLKQGINNDVGALFSHWKLCLAREKRNLVAHDLYGGSLWSASLEAFREIQGEKTLWIISCGYGLVSGEDKITGYHATFKPGKKDSVFNKKYFTETRSDEVSKQWWNMLSDNRVFESDHPTSIHELVNSLGKDDVIILAAGKDYQKAISEDLSMINISSNMPKLKIIGIKETYSGYDPDIPENLVSNIIPFSNGGACCGFLKQQFGKCNNIQMNSKSARWVIREYNRTGIFPKRMAALH